MGGNIGAHTLHLADAVGESGRVLACEPTADAFARLLVNIASNSTLAPRVTARQAMLLGREDAPLSEAVISSWPLRPDTDVHPTIRGRARPTKGGRAATFDALVTEWGVERVHLIKLDVDGYECDVLDGAHETLRRHHPVIISEIAPHALEATGRTLAELLDRFAALGYRLDRMSDGQPLVQRDFTRLAEQGVSANVIARAL